MISVIKVLVLDDEDAIRSFIRVNLKRHNFFVIEAATGEEALEKAEQNKDIKIALLDIMLPGIDGLEVCKCLRKEYPTIGIIMLTAKGQEDDKITGLSGGADDYVVKPFSPNELIARINALLRRMNVLSPQENTQRKALFSGPFMVNLDNRKVLKNEQELELTPKEYGIIKFFIENDNKAMSRNEILDEVWGKNYVGDVKVVDVNIRRLRQKIETDPANPQFIERVWGFGYCWRGGD